VSLLVISDYKTIYDITNTSLDAKIASMLDYAQSVADSYCGYSLEEAVYSSELHDGGVDSIILDNEPVTAITSVLISGVSTTDYLLYKNAKLVYGKLQKSNIDSRKVFPSGMQNVSVSYTAGYTAVTMPSDLKLALVKITRSIMNDKQGSNGVVRQTLHGEDRQFSKDISEYITSEIQSLLNTYKKWF